MKNFIILFVSVLIFQSCKKNDTGDPIITSAEYKVEDTMKLSTTYSTSDPTFYNNYNNKGYSNTEINMISNFTVDADGISILFQDNNTTKGNTLVIKFLGKTLDNISGTYDLMGNSGVKYTHSQNFYGSTFLQSTLKQFESGQITINYSISNNALNGFVRDAKQFIGVYVPYQSSSKGITQTVSQGNILLSNQSFRKYNIVFNFIKKQ